MNVVLFNELSLSRNISGFNFPSKLDVKDGNEIFKNIDKAIENNGYEFIKTCEMSSLDKLQLLQKIRDGAEILKNESISGVYFNDSLPNILVNGKDHIKIIKESRDLNLKENYDEISKIDDLIDDKIKYSFREDFGFLTSNPNLCGTGLRIKVYLHLPATNYYSIDSISNSLQKLGYRINPMFLYNKGSLDLFELVLDKNLGTKEEDNIDKLLSITKEIVEIENQNRKNLYLDRIMDLEDMVNRAYGILSNARIISEDEMIDCFSKLFLGIELSVIKPSISLNLLDTINNFKNRNLQIQRRSLLDERTRDILRANNIRKMMKEVF